MAHTIYAGEKIIVRYSSVNGELWFSEGDDNDNERISSAILDLSTDELHGIIQALKRFAEEGH